MHSAWPSALVISVASAQTPSNKQEQVPTAILLNGVPWLSIPHVTSAAEPAGTGLSNI
jgi:hypothetical protein